MVSRSVRGLLILGLLPYAINALYFQDDMMKGALQGTEEETSGGCNAANPFHPNPDTNAADLRVRAMTTNLYAAWWSACKTSPSLEDQNRSWLDMKSRWKRAKTLYHHRVRRNWRFAWEKYPAEDDERTPISSSNVTGSMNTTIMTSNGFPANVKTSWTDHGPRSWPQGCTAHRNVSGRWALNQNPVNSYVKEKVCIAYLEMWQIACAGLASGKRSKGENGTIKQEYLDYARKGWKVFRHAIRKHVRRWRLD